MEASGCGEMLGPEKGLLASAKWQKAGRLFGVFDSVAGGIEKMVSHRCSLPRGSKKECQCSSCSHSMIYATESYGSQEPILISPAQESIQPVPHVESSTRGVPTQAVPRTTIRRTVPEPPTLPLPTRSNDLDLDRPGRTFDELNNPFEDDSASHMARGQRGILQATFAQGEADRSQQREQSQQDVDEYADYFRE
ncbi:calpain [Rhodopirellula sallentina SM41]|uniref:Calpain n=2 Tax=Rhodopirellula TaxID=265488 RepID=M5U8N9_9BACT|nr:calpain [Rhodopirellula sallentina SM41]